MCMSHYLGCWNISYFAYHVINEFYEPSDCIKRDGLSCQWLVLVIYASKKNWA